jgi:hypothetical protein
MGESSAIAHTWMAMSTDFRRDWGYSWIKTLRKSLQNTSVQNVVAACTGSSCVALPTDSDISFPLELVTPSTTTWMRYMPLPGPDDFNNKTEQAKYPHLVLPNLLSDYLRASGPPSMPAVFQRPPARVVDSHSSTQAMAELTPAQQHYLPLNVTQSMCAA